MNVSPRRRLLSHHLDAPPSKPYRGKYADREQARVMRQAMARAWQQHQKALATETPRQVLRLQPGDVKRKVYLPPAGSIALGLLYQVAR